MFNDDNIKSIVLSDMFLEKINKYHEFELKKIFEVINNRNITFNKLDIHDAGRWSNIDDNISNYNHDNLVKITSDYGFELLGLIEEFNDRRKIKIININ